MLKEGFKLGLLNAGVPTKYGGLGLNCLDECVILEEMAFGCTGIETAFAATGLAVSSVCVVRVCGACVWVGG